MRTLSVFCCLASGLVVLPVYAQDSSAESRLVAERFFETKIRPALAEHCYKCHGDGKHKGGLQADSLEGLLQGGDSGPAITPGHPAESLLLQAISYADDAPVQMPPTGKLPEAVIADFKTWIAQGTRAKLRFDSIILRGTEVLTTAQITLCCVKMAEQQLCSMPDSLLIYAS